MILPTTMFKFVSLNVIHAKYSLVITC